MRVQGVRGATTVEQDCPEAIVSATRALLLSIQEANPKLHPDEMASIIFTVTEDLKMAFPSEAARELGWWQVPLLCAREIPVPGSLPGCIRVLIHWNTDLSQSEIRHVYMGAAAHLRPDLAGAEYQMREERDR